MSTDTAPTPTDLGSFANQARMAFDVPLVAWHPLLAAAALDHARDLLRTNAFSHDGSDGSSVWDRVQRHGGAWTLIGENLAMGMTRPGQAISGWLQSPGHRENLLRPDFTHEGSAVLALPPRPLTQPGFLWVQVYGTPITSGHGPLSTQPKGDPWSLCRRFRRHT